MEDFEEWLAATQARGLQPYAETAGGEVSLWRLELKLNDLGHKTLDRAHDADLGALMLEMDGEARRDVGRRLL